MGIVILVGVSSTTEADKSESDPSEGGKYLVIREWGVRFLLPVKLYGDIYYEYSTADQNKKTTGVALESVRLRSRTLDRITAHCNGNIFYMFERISRTAEKLSANEYADIQNERNFVELDGYWYHLFTNGNEAVATQECENPTAVSNEKDAFRISIGGAQAEYDSVKKLELFAQ